MWEIQLNTTSYRIFPGNPEADELKYLTLGQETAKNQELSFISNIKSQKQLTGRIYMPVMQGCLIQADLDKYPYRVINADLIYASLGPGLASRTFMRLNGKQDLCRACPAKLDCPYTYQDNPFTAYHDTMKAIADLHFEWILLKALYPHIGETLNAQRIADLNGTTRTSVIAIFNNNKYKEAACVERVSSGPNEDRGYGMPEEPYPQICEGCKINWMCEFSKLLSISDRLKNYS